jgi:hypothetical protein
MVALPAGRFQMGDDHGRANERPVHPVEIPRFAMGRTEVTFAQWDACVADGGCDGYKASDYDNWGRGDRPVIHVSWVNAQSYVRWINRKVGAEVYRLPGSMRRGRERPPRISGATTRILGALSPTSSIGRRSRLIHIDFRRVVMMASCTPRRSAHSSPTASVSRT